MLCSEETGTGSSAAARCRAIDSPQSIGTYSERQGLSIHKSPPGGLAFDEVQTSRDNSFPGGEFDEDAMTQNDISAPVGNRVIMSARPFRLFSPHLAESPKTARKKHPLLDFQHQFPIL